MASALCAEGIFDWEKIRTETLRCSRPFRFGALSSFRKVLVMHIAPMTPPFAATKGDVDGR
jgi:hypothetical protein